MPNLLTQQELNPEFLKKISNWQLLATKLKEIKGLEMSLRKEIIAELHPGAKKGTHNTKLKNGYKLKAVIKEETKIILENLDNMLKTFKEEETGESLENVIIYKPTFSAKGYKELSLPARAIVDTALVVNSASPSLELVAPKEEK